MNKIKTRRFINDQIAAAEEARNKKLQSAIRFFEYEDIQQLCQELAVTRQSLREQVIATCKRWAPIAMKKAFGVPTIHITPHQISMLKLRKYSDEFLQEFKRDMALHLNSSVWDVPFLRLDQIGCLLASEVYTLQDFIDQKHNLVRHQGSHIGKITSDKIEELYKKLADCENRVLKKR